MLHYYADTPQIFCLIHIVLYIVRVRMRIFDLTMYDNDINYLVSTLQNSPYYIYQRNDIYSGALPEPKNEFKQVVSRNGPTGSKNERERTRDLLFHPPQRYYNNNVSNNHTNYHLFLT